MTHSIAALTDWRGPSRQDARAVELVHQFVDGPVFLSSPGNHTSGQVHIPGWNGSMTGQGGDQHVSLDPRIAEALSYRRPQPRAAMAA